MLQNKNSYLRSKQKNPWYNKLKNSSTKYNIYNTKDNNKNF